MDDVSVESKPPALDGQTIKFVYIDDQGVEHEVSGRVGESLMTIARENLISGISGDCGGNCACGTCCIEIASTYALNLPPPDNDERDLLTFAKDTPGACRLGCQIKLCTELAGATVTVVVD